jgi:transposase-like protein
MHVVRLTLEGRESVGRAATLLGISPRQMKRLRRKMREQGVKGLLHDNRGKPAWNKTASEKQEQVIRLARGQYRGLNDTHLTEKLKEIGAYGKPDYTQRHRVRRDFLFQTLLSASSASLQ